MDLIGGLDLEGCRNVSELELRLPLFWSLLCLSSLVLLRYLERSQRRLGSFSVLLHRMCCLLSHTCRLLHRIPGVLSRLRSC